MISIKKNQGKLAGKPPPKTSIEDGIGIRLKAAREVKGLTQTDLHNLSGLSRMVISKYESGQNKPGARELRLLCDALEISPNMLIYGTEEPISKSEGLADTILSMGASAIAPLMSMVSLLPAILGRDDTRIILIMIESLLKAKSPEGYADIMKIVDASKLLSKHPAMKDINKASQLFDDPSAQQQIHDMANRLEQIKKKADSL